MPTGVRPQSRRLRPNARRARDRRSPGRLRWAMAPPPQMRRSPAPAAVRPMRPSLAKESMGQADEGYAQADDWFAGDMIAP